MPLALPPLGPGAKRALRGAGWALLALVSFVIALQATFPYQRVVDKAVEALSPRYDVSVGEVDRGWSPGKVILRAVTLRSRPAKPGDEPSTMYFQTLELDVNLLASLFGMRLDTDLDLEVGSGHIAGSIAVGKDGFDVSLAGEGIPSDRMPGMGEVVGLPMTGNVDPLIELDLPKNDWRQAKGRIRLVCPKGCTVGDGVTKLKFKLKPGSRQAAFASEGVTIDKMFIDRFALQVDIAKGKLSIGTWELKSNDLEAKLELQVQLAKSISESVVSSGCLRYKPSDTLSTRAPKTHAALMSTGAPLGPDSYYHILLQGRVAEMKRLPRVCGGESGSGEGEEGGRRRPSLGRGAPDNPLPPPAVATPPPSVPEPAAPIGGKGDDISPVQSPSEDPGHGAVLHDGGMPPSMGTGTGAGSAMPSMPPPPPPPSATGGMVETPSGIVPAPSEPPVGDQAQPPPTTEGGAGEVK